MPKELDRKVRLNYRDTENGDANTRYQIRRLDWHYFDVIVWSVVDTHSHDLLCATSTDREFVQRIADGLNKDPRYA